MGPWDDSTTGMGFIVGDSERAMGAWTGQGDAGMTLAYTQWWVAHQSVRITVPGAPPPVEQAQGAVDGAGDGGKAAMMPPPAQGAQQGPHGCRAVTRRGP